MECVSNVEGPLDFDGPRRVGLVSHPPPHLRAGATNRRALLTNMSSTTATFIYRGQLGIELSRIRFLLAATCATFDKVDVVLLSPGAGASRTEWEDFARTFPAVRSCAFVRAGSGSVLRVRRHLAELIAPDAADVIGVGFSVAAFLPMRKCLAWAVNGIPEERLLHGSNLENPYRRSAVVDGGEENRPGAYGRRLRANGTTD